MIYFSVIIPMFNAKNTIRRTLESVIKQTYSLPIEIIIINDGSNDGCEKIVEEVISTSYQINRTIKLLNQKNSGVSCARNSGLKQAVGKYMAFLDSDDMWHPQKLELIAQILEENLIDVIGHGFTLEDNSQVSYAVKKIKKIFFFKLLFKNFAVTPSIVIDRKVCQLFNESMKYTEDHELWLRLGLVKDIYYVDLPLTLLGRVPLSNGGLSSDQWAMRKGELQMYRNIISHKKSLIPLYPFFITFSLIKHFKNKTKDFFAKTQYTK